MSERLPKKQTAKNKRVHRNREKYVLRLFVAGILPNSTRAIMNIKALCETYLKGKYELEIIDIYQQPDLAVKENIIAVPLLIKTSPSPVERLIGDLSDTKKVLRGLGLRK